MGADTAVPAPNPISHQQSLASHVEAVGAATAAAGSTRVDHKAGSLCGHREVTGVHTIVLSQLNAGAVDGCGGHLTLCGRDADLHLVILIEVGARGHGVAVLRHVGRTTTALADGQRIALRGL